MKKFIGLKGLSVVGSVLVLAVFIGFSFYVGVSAQTNEEKAVADVLRQNATAFAMNDMAAVEFGGYVYG